MKKFFILTTIPGTFSFFKGQPQLWKNYFDVCLISSDINNLKERARQEGVRCKCIPMKREISLLYDILSLIRLVVFFIKEKPYIVHGNTPKASFLSMIAARVTRCPVRIYMCHGLRYQTTSGLLRKILILMEKISCTCANHVICVSNSVMETMINDGICHVRKISVVGYGSAGGVDIKYFSPSSLVKPIVGKGELNIPEDAFVFCFVGRIVKDKGINELLMAFERLNTEINNTYLLLVGGYEEADPISHESYRIISTNDNVICTGRVRDVRPYLNMSDALVLPSYREGFGMVVLEANSMGVPSIVSDIVGCRDAVVPLINGEFVQPRDEDSLYEVMRKWVDNPEYLKKMAMQCRTFVEERFARDKVVQLYYNEYLKMVKELC